ncbi:MAG: ABC transporter permease [Gammaproteobacteria bacterium]|nr:MAG: ABC transporter permease [Gammaproteobacteria bacterium]RLA33317.1 MAG: ABC transporter permease [Gammaproteobacteria bacterium]
MLKRIYAIFRARNLEFIRDRGSMSWNIILPVALMFGLSFIFGADRAEYTVGVLQSGTEIDASAHPFLETRYIQFVVVNDEADGFRRVARHQLDLLMQIEGQQRYWVNPDSPKGYFAELALLQADADAGGDITKEQISGEPVRYVDWVLPGILGMNMMFSCLFGVGYVVVRYRKNGFLKRLRATPLRAIEFVIAQVASRLVLVTLITSFVFAGTKYFLDTRMDGSYITLFIVLVVGAVSLISMGLMIAARVTSEELAGGLLNMVTWPMMMLSGVWFSLEAANDAVRNIAKVFPLTHILDSARAVMLDGANLAAIAPQLIALLAMTAVFLVIGAVIFRWHPN